MCNVHKKCWYVSVIFVLVCHMTLNIVLVVAQHQVNPPDQNQSVPSLESQSKSITETEPVLVSNKNGYRAPTTTMGNDEDEQVKQDEPGSGEQNNDDYIDDELKPKISINVVRKGVGNGTKEAATPNVFILDITNFTQVLVTCTAPYRLTWDANLEVVRTLTLINSFREVQNIFDPSTFNYTSTMTIDVDSQTQGEVRCSSWEDTRLWNLVLLVQQGKKMPQFQAGGQRVQFFNYRLEPDTNDGRFQIPCAARYPGVEAKLVQIFNEGQGNETRVEIKEKYELKFGFFIPPSYGDEDGFLRGTFQCITINPPIVENETDIGRVLFSQQSWVGYSLPAENRTAEFLVNPDNPKYRWQDVTVLSLGLGYITGGTGKENETSVSISDSDSELDEKGEIFVGTFIQTGGMECRNLKETRSRQILLNVPCFNPQECGVTDTCFNTNLCSAKMLEGTPCNSGACLSLPTVHFSGAILCSSGKEINRDYYFTGLDRVNYWTHTDKSIPSRALIRMDEVDPILYTNQEHFFFCEASSFFFTPEIQFALLMKNDSLIQLQEDSFRDADPDVIQRTSRGAIFRGGSLNLTNQVRGVMCLVPWFNSTEWMNMTRTFLARDVAPPMINEQSKRDQVFYVGQENGNLLCSSGGDPPPTLKWIISKNNTKILIGAGEKILGFEVRATEDGGSILNFPKITKDFAGVYICNASNQFGNDSLKYSVKVDEPGISAATLSSIAVLGLLLIISFCLVLRKYLLTKRTLRNLTHSEIQEFEKGSPEKLKELPEDGTAAVENYQYLPFNKKYELKESELSISENDILGHGEFGKVLAGKLKDVPVAVKTTKVNTDVNVFKEFLKEIKVMTHIGEHENVVKLLGAVTNKIRKRLVYIVVELSPFGSLESHLEKNRHNFVPFKHQNQNQRQIQENGQVKIVITILDMIKWSMEIARGMSHLASKKIIHGDLAVRNILLFDNYTAKITDFGLSLHLYDKTYAKKQLAMMPWRSMAIETLRDLKFSTQSDIWAFGILVWEIFTLAQVPYPGINLTPQFLDQLEGGMRTHKPPLASTHIYDVMLKCWNINPDQRPSFQELASIFHTFRTTDSTSVTFQPLQLHRGREDNINAHKTPSRSRSTSSTNGDGFDQVEMENMANANYTGFESLL